MRRIQDVHVIATEPLIAPHLLKNEMPVDEGIARTVVEARETIREILAGRDRRMLCIVGPCSIHDPDAAIDYARRLAKLKDATSDAALPRDARVLREAAHDRRMERAHQRSAHGRQLRYARGTCASRAGLLIEINRMGSPAGTEMLDPITPQYIADLIAWAAIGARTTESQTHREMASGLSMPVGFKNTTEGNLQVAINAIESARRPHSFLGITQEGMSAVISHLRQSRYARRAARWTQAELRRRQYRGMPNECSPKRRARAARDGGLLARADQQGLHQAARGVAHADRTDTRRQ